MSFPFLPPRQMLAAAVAAVAPSLRTSASRIESWRLCRRRWAFEYIDGVPRVQNEAAALGDRVHKLREDYLRFGIWPTRDTREGKLALAGLEKIPPPRIADVERKFEFELGRVLYRGRIDFLLMNNGAHTWGRRGVPLVGDHKTTSAEKYVKTPAHLTGGDPQGAIYGAYALKLSDDLGMRAREVDLHWSYIIKETRPRERQVRASMSRGQVEDSLARVVNDAQEMLTLVQIPGIKALALEPNVRACEAFGGCPYKSICPLTQAQRFGAFMFEQNLPPANGFAGQNLNAALPQGPGFAPNGQPPGQQQFNPQGFAPNGQPAQQMAPQPTFVAQGPQAQPHAGFAPQAPASFAPQAPQQAPITARQPDGSTWMQMNGQWVQTGAATQPAPAPQPVPTAAVASQSLQEVTYAASLVVAGQPLPANATPEVVRQYSQFIQRPDLAQQYLQAQARAAQGGVALSTGVVPPDAPPANTASTTPDDKKGKGAAKAPTVKAEQVTEITIALGRIATALEELARFAAKATELDAAARQPQPQNFQAQPPMQQQPQFQQQSLPPGGFVMPNQGGFAPGTGG